MSLSVADFLILSMVHLIMIQNALQRGPIFGNIGCKVYATVSSVAALAEIWTLTLVSIDRCQAIFHPLETKKRMSSVQVRFNLALIWGLSIGFSLAPLLGWNKYNAEAYLLGCSFDAFESSWDSRSYILVLIVLAWIAPITIIGYCYLRIIQNVKSNLYMLSERKHQPQRNAEEEKARKVYT